MKHPVSTLLAVISLFAPVILLAAEPTPTPKPQAARKLKGGNFGLPPVPTPTGGGFRSGSIANAARKTQEEDSASSQKPSRGVVITNESLRQAAPTPGGASITIQGTAKSSSRAKISPTPDTRPLVSPEYRDASGRMEADWRKIATIARERIERADANLVSAQENVKRLENDFYAWSDGNYRERVIRPAWDQAKEKLRLLETEAEAARTGLADLEEDARKSGTPPGWLR